MRRATARGLVLSVILAAAIAGGCQSEAKRHLYRAEDLFEKRDLDGARKELELSIKADPNSLDAHKSLAHIAELLGDEDEAAREYNRASELDQADQKLMEKARYYQQFQELANSSAKALDDIKAGKIEDGVGTLKNILLQAKLKSLREKALSALTDAVAQIEKQGDQRIAAGKYADAIGIYDQGIRAAMLLSAAHGMQQLDPGADPMLHKLNQAAQSAGTPDAALKPLSDVIDSYPDDKTANMELARVYLSHTPPDYETAADAEERGGAPDDEVARLRAQAKKHHK